MSRSQLVDCKMLTKKITNPFQGVAFSTAYTVFSQLQTGVWLLTLDGILVHPVALNILTGVPNRMLVYPLVNLAGKRRCENKYGHPNEPASFLSVLSTLTRVNVHSFTSLQMEDSSETSSQAQNGEKTQAINEENIAKAAASALAAAAVKAKVTFLWLIIWCIVHNLTKTRSHYFGNHALLKSVLRHNIPNTRPFLCGRLNFFNLNDFQSKVLIFSLKCFLIIWQYSVGVLGQGMK